MSTRTERARRGDRPARPHYCGAAPRRARPALASLRRARRRSLHPHHVAELDLTFAQHARIKPAPARMNFLRYALELAVAETAEQIGAGRRICRQLEQHFSHFDARAGDHALPHVTRIAPQLRY